MIDSVRAIVRKFLKGTAAIMALLAAAVPALGWAGYFVLTPDKQLAWDERGDELTKVMLYLMNSKNEQAKKELNFGLFSRKDDSLFAKYQSNGSISIDTISQQQARQST